MDQYLTYKDEILDIATKTDPLLQKTVWIHPDSFKTAFELFFSGLNNIGIDDLEKFDNGLSFCGCVNP